ncbi:MAG: M20/M25/M40 family metallo-hydrolase [Candidatus Cloacimonetes bacterium]|nr:M20/M25/M40 family metallo-hydrolase [Candidatus Cloacimonadota bacterium]
MNVVDYFIELVRIDSESRSEGAIAQKIAADVSSFGWKCEFDNASKYTGGDSGNLYIFIPGVVNKPPLMFSAHMDTVKPGKGVKPTIIDGYIRTDGTTILGADDKSGIAEILAAVYHLQEEKIPHVPLEIVFTVCEEIGLLGAKHVVLDRLKARMGFALDYHKVGTFLMGAPSQNTIEMVITGKEAHAGLEPEKGVSAIVVASHAISRLNLGRIDDETTCNIGIIKGGSATNIIPNEVYLKGEVRSHNPETLEEVTDNIVNTVRETVESHTVGDFTASVKITIKREYDSYRLPDEDPLCSLAAKSAQAIGESGNLGICGGGSDANYFNKIGIKTIVAGSGMNKVHTVDEEILVSELKDGQRWIEEVIRLYSNE